MDLIENKHFFNNEENNQQGNGNGKDNFKKKKMIFEITKNIPEEKSLFLFIFYSPIDNFTLSNNNNNNNSQNKIIPSFQSNFHSKCDSLSFSRSHLSS